MASTFTTNIGVEKPGTGDKAGTWGTMTNTNMDLVDEATNGVVSVTLSATGSSGSPNDLPITNGASSNGRNKFIEFVDSGDIGGNVFVQLTPNDAEKVVFVRNSLSGSRSIFIFQGTYNTGRDVELLNGKDYVLKFPGGGSSSTVVNVLDNPVIGTNLTVTGDATVGDDLSLTSDSSVLSFGADSDVTFTHAADAGVTMAVTGNNIPIFKIFEDKNDSSGGPQLTLTREYASTTPADDDQGGTIIFQMENDNNETNTMCQISTINADVTDGSEKGEFQFYVKDGGSSSTVVNVLDNPVIGTNLTVTGDATVGDDLSLTSDSSVLSFGADSDVTFTHVADSGVTMAVTGNNIPIFKISEDRNDSSGGPQVILTREYASTTPADDDQGGTIIFQMENDNDETNTMCQISTINADVTDGSEKGEFQFYVKDGSSFPNILKIGVGNSNVREVLPGADSAAILGTDSNYSNTGSGVLKWLRVHADRLVSGTGTTFSASGTAVALGLASGESGIAVRTGETTMSPMTFEVGSSTVGSISCTSDATSYNTTSDYRLKENIVDMSGAMDRIKELKPKRFNFKTNTDKTVDGFLAHEAQKVVPEAVTGEKDGLLNGQILAQSIDQSKLIPLLTGALQEALAEIDALKVRVAFLEEK